jgi:hypothetical protein
VYTVVAAAPSRRGGRSADRGRDGLVVHSVYTDAGWSAPRSGFAWLGVAMFTPVLVIVAALACRAARRRDSEAYLAAAAFFGLVAAVFMIALGEAAAVWLGLRDGKLPAVGLAFVLGVWAYSVLMGLGHWHLYRVYRAAQARQVEADAAGRPSAQ